MDVDKFLESVPEPSQHDNWVGKDPPLEARVKAEASAQQAELGKSLEAELQERYGSPAYKNSRGRISRLNEPFWAALYAKEHPILFEPDEEKFFEYNSAAGIYEEKSVDLIRKELAERIFVAGSEWEKFYSGLGEFRNNDALRGIIQHLRGSAEERDAFAKDKAIVYLANCDLRIGIDGFSKTDISPESKTRWRLPFCYDENADCQRFKNELLAPLDLDQQLILQKVFALFLTGENPLHRIVVLDAKDDGKGGAGKTALALVFHEILGPKKAGSLRTSFLEDRFEVGRFYDKSLLIGADVGSEFLQEAGAAALKRLTGGDYFEGEIKSSNRVIGIYGRFNVLITSNVRLKIRLANDSSAWLRRLIIIRYGRPRASPTIFDFHKVLIKEEGPGILNWGLAGLKLLRQDVERTGDIVLTEDIDQIVRSLVEESDGLRLFLKNNLVPDDDFDVSVDEITKAYTIHCKTMEWSVEPIKRLQSEIERLMLELFSTPKRGDIPRGGKSVRGYKGVKILKPRQSPFYASEASEPETPEDEDS